MLDNDIRCSNILDDDMSEPQTTGNLKAIAKRSGLSGVQIAEQMGMRPETVSRHLNGKQNISIEDATRYAKILGCTPEDILFQRSMCPIIGELSNDGIFNNWGQDESKRRFLAGPLSFQPYHAAYLCPGWFTKKKTAIGIIDRRPIEKRYVHDQSVGQISLNYIQGIGDHKKDLIVAGYCFENSDFTTHTVRRIVNMVEAMQSIDRKKNAQYPHTEKEFMPNCKLVYSTPILFMLYDPPSTGFEIVKDN